MLSRAPGKLLRKHTCKWWVLEQGLDYAKTRIREAVAQAWVHKQRLSCVKSRIREAVAQARAKSPPCPKTYSWTAAVSLLGKSVTRISTCVREETRNQRRLALGLLCARKKISCDKKNCCVLTPPAHGSPSMRTETCSCEKTVANSRRPIG